MNSPSGLLQGANALAPNSLVGTGGAAPVSVTVSARAAASAGAFVSVSVAGAADADPRSSSHAAGVSLEGIMFVDLIGWFGTAVQVGKVCLSRLWVGRCGNV